MRSRPSCSVGTVCAVDTFSGFRLALRFRFKADLQACIGDTSLPPDKRFLCLSERGTLDWPWLREQQIASLQQFLQPSPGLDYATKVFDNINSRFAAYARSVANTALATCSYLRSGVAELAAAATEDPQPCITVLAVSDTAHAIVSDGPSSQYVVVRNCAGQARRHNDGETKTVCTHASTVPDLFCPLGAPCNETQNGSVPGQGCGSLHCVWCRRTSDVASLQVLKP